MPASDWEVLVARRYLDRGFLDAALKLLVRNAELVTSADWSKLAERLMERNRIADVVRVCELGEVPLPREKMLGLADRHLRRKDIDSTMRLYELVGADRERWVRLLDVLAALARALDASVRLYPDPEARALRARASAVYDVPADHILAGNGSDELLALILRACVDPGHRVAFPVPTYSLYDTLVAAQGGEAVRIPFAEDFRLPSEVGRSRARVTFLCNPNSPSGTFVPVEEVEALAQAVAGVLVVDEAYVDFARDHALRLVGRHANVLVVRTLSKSFSLAGPRLGPAAGHPEVLAGA